MQKEECVLKIYTFLYIIAAAIIGIIVIETMQNTGEASVLPVRLDRINIIFLLILHLLTLAVIFPFYKATKNINLYEKKRGKFQFTFRKKWLHRFVLAILLVQTIYVIQAGYGNAGGNFNNTRPCLTMVLNLMKISSFFPIYFVCAREKKFIYWCNTFLFLGMRILQGWSGEILSIIFIEAYLFLKYHRININLEKLLKHALALSSLAIMSGAILYKIVYPLKNYFRGWGFLGISYYEGLRNLVLRLTSFPIDIVAVQNNQEIATLYQVQGMRYAEIISVFRSLVPNAIFKNKDFSILNAIIMQTIYPDMTGGTSSNYNPFLYAYNLLSADIRGFFIYFIFSIVFFIITKKLLQCLDDGSKDVNILYFIFVFQCFTNGSLEVIYAYGYLGSIYILVLLLIFGIMRVSKRL